MMLFKSHIIKCQKSIRKRVREVYQLKKNNGNIRDPYNIGKLIASTNDAYNLYQFKTKTFTGYFSSLFNVRSCAFYARRVYNERYHALEKALNSLEKEIKNKKVIQFDDIKKKPKISNNNDAIQSERYTPVLKNSVKEPKKEDLNNDVLKKTFHRFG